MNRKQFKPSEVASNLQKVRGYVNDGTRILNGITLNRYSEAGNELRVISLYGRSERGDFLCQPHACVLYQLLLVNDQLELQAELFCRLSAKHHSLHEDLKILHNRAVLRINHQLQFYQCFVLVDLQ